MSEWNKEKLNKIKNSDDLYIAPFREDGKTYGTLTWIWSVIVNDELFVRAYNGKNSSWYKSAVKQKAGKIKAAEMEFEVNFEQVDINDSIQKLIDDAYKMKYSSSPYLTSMISDRARSATVKIIKKN